MFFVVLLSVFSRDRSHLYVARSGTKLEKTSLSADGNIRPLQMLREPNLFFTFEIAYILAILFIAKYEV